LAAFFATIDALRAGGFFATLFAGAVTFFAAVDLLAALFVATAFFAGADFFVAPALFLAGAAFVKAFTTDGALVAAGNAAAITGFFGARRALRSAFKPSPGVNPMPLDALIFTAAPV
jgi:hypothetical protein